MLRQVACWSRLSKGLEKQRTPCRSITTQEIETEFKSNIKYYQKLNQRQEWIQVGLTESSGRGLFAKKDIEEGEIILAEKPIVAAAHGANEEVNHCWSCFRPLFPTNLIPTDDGVKRHLKSLSDPQKEGLKQQILGDLGIRPMNKPLSHETHSRSVQFCSPKCSNDARINQRVLLHTSPSRFVELENWLFDLPLNERQLSIMNLMVRLIGLASTDPGFVTHNLNRYVNQDAPVSKVFPDKQQQQEMYGKLLEMFPESKQAFPTVQSLVDLECLIGMNSFAVTTSPISVALRMPGGKDMQMQVIKDQAHAVKITAMYETGSFANHSCDPNVGLRSPSVTSEVLWVAFKPIRKGEEILCSYIPTDLSTAERKEILLRSYGFECKCPRCSSSPNH
eukprot:TRINITY_DN6417_c0_g1_i1.p1 TRINITY_DN6417_c0_g1~~TRINITY_DN6417_c0_g1_i1.p1  ORF type:complete len:392 (+),score=42.58 TRINITY_DN6417_c0_g1_i1:40-1215(+)